MSQFDDDEEDPMAGFCEECGEQLRPNGDCPNCDEFEDRTFVGDAPKSLWDDPEVIGVDPGDKEIND